jgi:hypothetical protein
VRNSQRHDSVTRSDAGSDGVPSLTDDNGSPSGGSDSGFLIDPPTPEDDDQGGLVYLLPIVELIFREWANRRLE